LGAAAAVDITVSKFGMISSAKRISVDADQNKVAIYNWTIHAVKPGVIYKTGQLALFGTAQRRIYILDVTLDANNALGIGFSTTNTATVTMCNNYGAVAGVNTGYFPLGSSTDKDPYIRINGSTVQAGHTNVPQIFTNSALIIHNNVAAVRKFTDSGKNLNLVAAAIPATQAQNMIVCGPMLITSGAIENLDMSVGHNSSLTGRTGLGVTADGKRVFMVVVDTGGSVTGVNTLHLAKILQALGAVNAMNFDGGGSSTMFVKDQGDNGRVNYPTGGTYQRPVRSVIYLK
jgi:exopolysaccharide biosynthesis protein